MEYNPHELEARLAALTPSAPDAALLDCLELVASGDPLRSTAMESALERQLGGFRPVAVSERISSAFLAAAGDMAFPVPSKVIPFPGHADSEAARNRRRQFGRYAAAAAVALLGGVSALLLPFQNKPQSVVRSAVPSHTPAVAASIPDATRRGFTPANFGRGVADVREHGRVWDRSGRPCRVVRVVYMDRASMVNGTGERVEVEQPRVEYILVPEKID